MYAIIQTCGRQYKVAKEDVIAIDKMTGKPGECVDFNEVLFASTNGEVKLGSPKIEGASVKAEIVNQFKEDKVIVFKKKRRHNYRRKNGHRQCLTNVKIKEITLIKINI